MEFSWKVTTSLICSYGFFKEMKPSEAFFMPYLNSTYKHLTQEEVNSQINPVWTYSYLVTLFFVFLVTDKLRYKPLIILEGLAYLTTRVLLIWGSGVLAMQFMNIAFGVSTGTEVAYYSYIYALVPTEHYQKVTSYLRGAVLLGRFSADVIAQLLISFDVTNYLVLNYISMSSVIVAMLLSFALPMPKVIGGNVFIVNHKDQVNDNEAAPGNTPTDVNDENTPTPTGDAPMSANDKTTPAPNCMKQWKDSIMVLLHAFRVSYSNHTLLRWSIWWALATCGYFQVGNYKQSLWQEVHGSQRNKSWNGGVDAVATLGSAGVAFVLSFVKVRWGVVGELLLGGLSLVDATLLFIMARSDNIWITYLAYIGFTMSYVFLITIASFQVALNVGDNAFALIFGWNMFVALALQTILTFIVADQNGLDLSIRNQFLVYGAYFAAIAMIYLTMPLLKSIKTFYNWIRKCLQKPDMEAETLSDELGENYGGLEGQSPPTPQFKTSRTFLVSF